MCEWCADEEAWRGDCLISQEFPRYQERSARFTISGQLQSSLVGFSQVKREYAGLLVGLVKDIIQLGYWQGRQPNEEADRDDLQQDEYQKGT